MRKILIKLFGLHPKKCYVLTQSSGSWDGIDVWVAGIYFHKAEAEKQREILIQQVEEARNISSPFESKEGLTEEEFEESLSEEELVIYNKWWNKNNDAWELNASVIREYLLNTEIKR
jgi:hypothetical protein